MEQQWPDGSVAARERHYWIFVGVLLVITIKSVPVASLEKREPIIIVVASIFVIGYIVAYLMTDNKCIAVVKGVPVHKK